MNVKEMTAIIHPAQIEQVILLIRGQRVMLDRDLAALYGVETKNLNKAVKRNLDRFRPAPAHRAPPSWAEETPKGWGGARIFWEKGRAV